MIGAQALVASLTGAGVDVCFMNPGYNNHISTYKTIYNINTFTYYHISYFHNTTKYNKTF